MLIQLSQNTWHISRLPHEDILIFSEKVGEREFLFFGEVGTNDSCLGELTST
jgi:hypothetical protein